MDDLVRRDLFAVLSTFAAASGLASANAQDAALSKSRVIRYADLPVRPLGNGGTIRRVLSGTLPTGEFIEVHESMLPAGQMPHPPHRHPNTEMLFIQTGTLEYVDDGKPVALAAGDIVFSASNVMHGLKNIGATEASYIVFSVGRQLPE